MRKFRIFSLIPLILMLTTVLTGCQVIGDIFKAGVWSGIILVVVIVGLVIFLVTRLFGGGNK